MSHLEELMPHVDRLFARDGGLHPPSEVLRSWPKPNYVDPEDRGWSSSIVLLVFLGITFLVYTARIWARLGLAKNAGLDDLLMSIAIIPLFGLTISAILGESIAPYRVHSQRSTSHENIWFPMGRMLSDQINFAYRQRGQSLYKPLSGPV